MKVSFHVGQSGKQMSQRHNRRELGAEKDGRLDPEMAYKNICFIDEDLETFLRSELKDAVDDFNNKQKKASRKKSLDDIIADGKKKAREVIVQFGDKNEHLTDEAAKVIYGEYLRSWQRENPTLKIFGAYLHLDETTPHMHVDFVPITDSARGMSKRVSMEGALKQLGYKDNKKDYSDKVFVRWTEEERKYLENLGRECGLNIEDHEPRSKEHDTRHKEHWQYAAQKAREEAQKAIAEKERLEGVVEEVKEELEELFNKYESYTLTDTYMSEYLKDQQMYEMDVWDRIEEIAKEGVFDDYDRDLY